MANATLRYRQAQYKSCPLIIQGWARYHWIIYVNVPEIFIKLSPQNGFRDFQFKKYPKISCSAGILPANNTRTGKIPLDSEELLQAVYFFCGVLLFNFSSNLTLSLSLDTLDSLINEPTCLSRITPTKIEVDSPKALMTVSLPDSILTFYLLPNLAFLNCNTVRYDYALNKSS